MSEPVNLHAIESGSSFPIGTSVSSTGVNFSIYSKSGTAVELLFFDRQMRIDHHMLSHSIVLITGRLTTGTRLSPV